MIASLSRPVLRHWCCQGNYEGKEAFVFGTVQAETELDALRAIQSLWGRTMPFALPATVAVIPGLLAFQPEEEG